MLVDPGHEPVACSTRPLHYQFYYRQLLYLFLRHQVHSAPLELPAGDPYILDSKNQQHVKEYRQQVLLLKSP